MRVLLQIIGFVLLVAGIVFTISPIPFSFTMVVIGASLIIANNRTVARWVRAWRMRWPGFNRAFERVERVLPERWRVDGGSVLDDFSNSRRDKD